jgi:hypothetical protein
MKGTIKKSCTCSGCNLWLTLEAERLDRSYLNHPSQHEPTEPPRYITKIKKETPKDREQRDKLMFNAGRYSAGARDIAATRADEVLQRELEKEVK